MTASGHAIFQQPRKPQHQSKERYRRTNHAGPKPVAGSPPMRLSVVLAAVEAIPAILALASTLSSSALPRCFISGPCQRTSGCFRLWYGGASDTASNHCLSIVMRQYGLPAGLLCGLLPTNCCWLIPGQYSGLPDILNLPTTVVAINSAGRPSSSDREPLLLFPLRDRVSGQVSTFRTSSFLVTVHKPAVLDG